MHVIQQIKSNEGVTMNIYAPRVYGEFSSMHILNIGSVHESKK